MIASEKVKTEISTDILSKQQKVLKEPYFTYNNVKYPF